MIQTILPQQQQYVESLLSDVDSTPLMPSFGEGRTLFQFEPSDNDVICSQNYYEFRNHAGNIAFQAIIDDNVYGYTSARSQLTKAAIVSNIVETIQKRSPNGGFVEQIGGQWFEIGTWNARERVLQALQEAPASSEQSEEIPYHVNVRLDILVSSCLFVPMKKATFSADTLDKRVSGSLPLDLPINHLSWNVLNELKREVFTLHQPTAGVVAERRPPRNF